MTMPSSCFATYSHSESILYRLKRVDRYLLSGAFALLFLEIFILSNDLNWIKINDLDESHNQTVIGKVLHVQDKVRRKKQDSIAWHDSFIHQNLKAYDSILTLDQSSAEIKLQNDIHITLHENTLIVLEPLKNKNDDPRLQFDKGMIVSRIKQRSIKFGSKFWNIKAEPGTDLSLKSLADNKLEIEVSRGQIQLANQLTKEVKTIADNSLIQTSPNGIEKQEFIAQDLKWLKNRDRVYSHNHPFIYELAWEGEASHIEVTPPEGDKFDMAVSGRTKTTLPLAQGTYSLRLKTLENKVSKTLVVESLVAPIIQYFSPLPRERVLTKADTYFNWTGLKNITSYKINFSSSQNKGSYELSHDSRDNYKTLQFSEDKKYFWSIEAYDQDNYQIPPLYQYEIFAKDDPFAAPNVKAPKLRNPANDKIKKHKTKEKPTLINQIFQWLVPKAHADEIQFREVKFEWDPIPNADFYIIEVSSTPNFINPVVNQRVFNNFYIWRENHVQDNYYLRVAAGDENGRMGLFSTPQMVNLKLIEIEPQKNKAKILTADDLKKITPIQYRETQTQDLQKEKVIAAEFTHSPIIKTQPIEPDQLIQFYFSAAYEWQQVDKTSDYSSELQSLIPFSGQFFGQNKNLQGLFSASFHQFKSDKNDYPFQDKLEYFNFNLALHHRLNPRHSLGLGFLYDHLLLRQDYEALKAHTMNFWGLSYIYSIPIKKWHHQFNLQVHQDSDYSNAFLWLRSYKKKLIYPWHIIYGGEIKAQYTTGNDLEKMGTIPALFLGLEW